LVVTTAGYEPVPPSELQLASSEVRTLTLTLVNLMAETPSSGPTGIPGPPRAEPLPDVSAASAYPGLRGPQPMAVEPTVAVEERAATEAENFVPEPYRWDVEMPEWKRYDKPGEFPYTESHWYDPFNRRRIKGDI